MSPVSSFRKGLYYSAKGADPFPAIIVGTQAPASSSANVTMVFLSVFKPGGVVEGKVAALRSSSDPVGTAAVDYFIEET